MAEETKTGENSQGTATAPPTEVVENRGSQNSAGENSGANQGSENRIPQSRFNEVIEQRNQERIAREQVEARLRMLESQTQSAPVDPIEAEVKHLVSKLKLTEEAARELVQSQNRLAEKKMLPLINQVRQYEVREWGRALGSKYKDYNDLVPEMEKIFGSLAPETQKMIVSSPENLEMYYHSVRAKKLESDGAANLNKGKQMAYETKGVKQAVSAASGNSSSSTGKTSLTKENLGAEIAKMDTKTYQARLSEIQAVLNS